MGFVVRLYFVSPKRTILRLIAKRAGKVLSVPSALFCFLLFSYLFAFIYPVWSQTTNFTPNYFQQSNNYIKSNLFRQEIARFEINVVRGNKAPLPITQVPRVNKDDILKVRLLDEAVNGIKLDQSLWDWTFLVTYINPNRRTAEFAKNKFQKDEPGTVSDEIRFSKQGWYREYSFTVPYDSQPVFFLYPRPKYRKQLLKVVSRNYEDIRKLGEKTIEIAGAYAQIGLFLNELQMVLNRNAQMYGYTYNPNSATNPYSPYNPYPTNPANPNAEIPLFGLPTVPMLNQVVEGLARSFNIALPSCWGNIQNYNNYGNYGGGSNSGYSSYGGYNYNNANNAADFVNRAQCVAKNINLEDFDVSVMKMWQQGGVFLAAELQKKYPQIAYWINIAAAAIDFIVKVFQKSPLRIVPTIVQSSDNQSGAYAGTYGTSYAYSNSSGSSAGNQQPVKLSLFAESQPNEGHFVTAYPIVVHKWQPEPDPEVISLYPPVLSTPCLQTGQNILKNTDISQAWSEDKYSRDFKLVMSSTNGFRKEFPLRKNIGLGGWELNLTAEDLNQIPKIGMTLESELVGLRGFNEIKSPKFDLPLAVGGSWEITHETQKDFSVGGKRKITLRNSMGSCRCLQRVIYKPSFGGQFVFEASADQNNPHSLQFSADGREVSFEIETSSFQPGQGTLEIKTYGDNQTMMMNQQNGNNLPLKLYPLPPNITNVKIAKGDREALLSGERLEQIQSIRINGRRAVLLNPNQGYGNAPYQPNYQNQGNPNSSANSPSNSPLYQPNRPPNGQTRPPVYQNQQPNAANQSPNSQFNSAQIANRNNLNGEFQSQYSNLNQNEKVFVFEDHNTQQTENNISLELVLEDERYFQNPRTFSASAARPAIIAPPTKEIEGLLWQDQPFDEAPVRTANPATLSVLAALGLFPVETNGITVRLQNKLTDHDFKVENIEIETRIEGSQINLNVLPQVSFEVLDWKTVKLNFLLQPAVQKLLGGRRIQFRMKDKLRGDSDWYTLKQTFVRSPNIEAIKCSSQSSPGSQSPQNSPSSGVGETNQLNTSVQNSVNSGTSNPVNFLPCELTGSGIDYISQVSVDGGRSWFPSLPNNLSTQPLPDQRTMARIPHLENKNQFLIKLRDHASGEGILISDFTYSNSVKTTKRNVTQVNQTPLNQPRANQKPSNIPQSKNSQKN